MYTYNNAIGYEILTCPMMKMILHNNIVHFQVSERIKNDMKIVILHVPLMMIIFLNDTKRF